ncbi:MAG: bifunctional folylpolyglutamate synthase/dihydrofolate synthase [Oscillospiraceae bacterium]|jgi:dihydrofolate synthase/folylpolyglutamate synthase|nr:bifunctional folylpolyglutamate synthase/dihydrofolate synthase [Oscillospiraceae bacterium]
MTDQQAIEYIHSRLRFGICPGLERIAKLEAAVGNPQDSLPIIHLAGTNGKGSTASMLASILKEAGFKTGLFTSPYVTDFCERISINGEMIPQQALASCVERLAPIVSQMEAAGEVITEFELITVLALLWYREEGCNALVLETGLGGRFDATNTVKKPLLSIITKIAYDHMDILGDTLQKITFEKCGIIKKGVNVVSYPAQAEEALAVIMERTAQEGGKLIIGNTNAATVTAESIFGTDMQYGGLKVRIPLAGRHQASNAITAIEAAKALRTQGMAISDADIENGIAKTVFAARQEVLSKSPLIILDGAHNPDGAETLAYSIKNYLKGRRVICIMGMLEGKNAEEALNILAPLFDKLYAVSLDNPRAMQVHKFASLARKHCREVVELENSKEAVTEALSELNGTTALVCCGSLYLAGELRPLLR